VNVAARIADYARPGEVLVSAQALAAEEHPGRGFEAIGEIPLKDVREPVGLHRVLPG
jgi:class 3 adenylate cyclase